ncbi:hypothetical protein SAMN05216338_10322 [Bradyrhizobium sp. Rc2d]|nr:hypothetical protein SAMN05216338_10322 [Bradyrhizobium sp. Rc2d]
MHRRKGRVLDKKLTGQFFAESEVKYAFENARQYPVTVVLRWKYKHCHGKYA